MVDRYRSYGVSEVIIKVGPDNYRVWIDDQHADVPAIAASQPVDTTGAGDSFNGTHIASQLPCNSPETSARTAHQVAAQIIMSRGVLVEMSKLRTNLSIGSVNPELSHRIHV